jgi:hypothetical protein
MLMKRKSDQGPESAERLALSVLGWIAGDEDRLYPFLNLTGLTPDTLRASAAEPGFLAGVLDFVMGDESVLMACAAALDVPPEHIVKAWRRLGPAEPDDGFS